MPPLLWCHNPVINIFIMSFIPSTLYNNVTNPSYQTITNPLTYHYQPLPSPSSTLPYPTLHYPTLPFQLLLSLTLPYEPLPYEPLPSRHQEELVAITAESKGSFRRDQDESDTRSSRLDDLPWAPELTIFNDGKPIEQVSYLKFSRLLEAEASKVKEGSGQIPPSEDVKISPGLGVSAGSVGGLLREHKVATPGTKPLAPKSLSRKAGSLTPEGKSLTPEGKSLTPEGKSLTPEGKSLTPEGKSLTPEGKSLTPEGKSLTPEGKSLTPEGNKAPVAASALDAVVSVSTTPVNSNVSATETRYRK